MTTPPLLRRGWGVGLFSHHGEEGDEGAGGGGRRRKNGGCGQFRPLNAQGAIVLSYVGENPPASSDPGWKIEGRTGSTTVLVQYPNDVPPGTKCWMTCLWYNARGWSPACDPIFTYRQVGPVAEAA